MNWCGALHDGDKMMPPKGARLTETEVTRIKQWIDEGAKWPERDDYWAFQPAKEPPLPKGKAVNPIDRFIESRLVAEKIKPMPQADARTLLRRAFFDLVGVPPTPEEAQLFLRDKSSEAYEKLIDRLLADPRYGERWARLSSASRSAAHATTTTNMTSSPSVITTACRLSSPA